MKTILYSILGCMAMAQVSYAALPALQESIAEYNAITTALSSNPNFNTVISSSEAIIDIKRLTRQVNVTGTIRYKIVTRSVSGDSSTSVETCNRCHRNHNSNVYIAVLVITPNDSLGPFVITVQSITQVSNNFHSVLNAEAQDLLNQED
jgi:hypothetical protein